MSYTSGLYYVTTSNYVALATGYTVVSGNITNSGINLNWSNYASASGVPDGQGVTFITPSGARTPGLLFSLDSSAISALAGQDVYGAIATLRVIASGVASTGSVATGYIHYNGRAVGGSYAFQVSATGVTSVTLGCSGCDWGVGTIPGDITSMGLVTDWAHPINMSGQISVDSVSLYLIYGTTLSPSVFHTDGSYPSYRRA